MLAFVSACHSEEIGEIFFKAGIPVVIAVNSETPIMDTVCKQFSQYFYQNLLDGCTIQQSFDKAKIEVSQSPNATDADFETCCCAHKHTADCVWYPLFQKDPEAAHNLHKIDCNCLFSEQNPVRAHKHTCQVYIKFREWLAK